MPKPLLSDEADWPDRGWWMTEGGVSTLCQADLVELGSRLSLPPTTDRMNLTWRPLDWPHFRRRSHLPEVSCVYLWTAAARDDPDDHFLYLVGETGDLRERIKAHSTSLRHGEWPILDIEALRRGERVVLWQGSAFGSRKAHDPRDAARIREDGERMMAGIRLFIAEMPDDRRLRQRVEGAIWSILMAQTPRLCDEGVFICYRGPNEAEITVTNKVVGGRLHGLPEAMVV